MDQDTFDGGMVLVLLVAAIAGSVYFWGAMATLFWFGVVGLSWCVLRSVLRSVLRR